MLNCCTLLFNGSVVNRGCTVFSIHSRVKKVWEVKDREKSALPLAKTTEFFGKGCAPFFLHILRSTLLERQRTVKPPSGA